MECSAEGCEFEARYSTTGLCLVCQGLYSSGIALPNAAGYNVPGNAHYTTEKPLDILVRSVKDPLGIEVDGSAWGVSYDANYGVSKDANGTFYLTQNLSKADYPVYFDGARNPYIVDAGKKRALRLVKTTDGLVPKPVYFFDGFSGTNGAALPAAWITGTNSQGGTVTIQNNKAVLAPSTDPYASGTVAYLSGIKSVSDFEFTCDYSLVSLEEQFHNLGLRTRNEQVWPSGGGANQPKTGYYFVLSPKYSIIQLQQGAQAGTVIDQITFTFPSKDMKMRAGVSGKNIRLKLWAADAPEPSAWTFDKPLATDETSGSVVFTAGNGGAPTSMSVTIDNFTMTTKAYDAADTQSAPVGDIPSFRQKFIENFNTPALAGKVESVYKNSWQPYPDGTGGRYYSGTQISVHDGVMDVYMDGSRGAAGSFGPASAAFSHVGGKFSMRAKAIGARGNGAAVMLWPSSDVWSQGEIDFPESNFDESPMVHHHYMQEGNEGANDAYSTGVSWRDWHTYSIEWIPGQSVKYFLDDVLVFTVTSNVPTTAHRYMFQVGNYGDVGHLYIDWVSTYDYDTSVVVVPSPMPTATNVSSSGHNWTMSYSQDFLTDAALGQFSSVYPQIASYTEEQGDTGSNQEVSTHGKYSTNKTASVANSALDIHQRVIGGTPYGAVILPDAYTPHVYGRVSLRYRTEDVSGLSGFKFVGLWWPSSDNWDDGEIDWPEADIEQASRPASASVEPAVYGSNGRTFYPPTSVYAPSDTSGWHVATVDWAPDGISYYWDGVLVTKVTDPKGVPDIPMRWALQAETFLGQGVVPAGADTHIYVDWVVIYNLNDAV